MGRSPGINWTAHPSSLPIDKLDGTPYHKGMEDDIPNNDRGADQLNWRHSSSCSGMSDLWYWEENTFKAAIASSICFQCPVRRECLKEACDKREPHGIWGGLPLSTRTQRGRAHNFLKLVDLPDPYTTEDSNSAFHISNLIDGDNDERE